jgi:hypothetical protein
MTANPDSIPGIVLSRFPQTCDLDLELAEPASITSSTPVAVAAGESKSPDDQFPSDAITEFVKPLSTESNLQVTEAGSFDSQQVHQVFWLALTPVAILVIAACIWMLARNENNPAREVHSNLPLRLENGNPINADARLIASQSGKASSFEEVPSSTVSAHQMKVWQQRAIAAEQKAQKANEVIRAGLMSYMREWLKQKLFRKLIADRTELLESQHLATMKVLAVDERLSRIELQIQQQNQAYEQRIEKLTQELAVTREESRSLIRAQINQIQGEMEAARARLIAEAESHDVVIT